MVLRPSWSLLGCSCLPFLSHRPRSNVHQTESTPLFPHSNSTQLHSTSHTSTQLNSSHFLTLRGAHFGASWLPKSTQDRLKSPLDTSFFQKREFSRNIGRRSVWSVSRAPRRPPKRPKIAPRPFQDDLQEHLFSTSFLTSISVRLGLHFGLILAPLGPPKGG